MCMRVKCEKCGKTTWAGCGAHVEQTLAGVPADQLCRCKDAQAQKPPSAGPKP